MIIYRYSYEILDHPAISEQGNELVKSDCSYELGSIFFLYSNYPAAHKYFKLAYETCLRSSDYRSRTKLSSCKDAFLKSRASFAALPPLRFAVGDEVEFLHELETGSEWQLGKVVELYYRDRSFEVNFTAPYRLQLLDDDDGDQAPVYAWVKADIDRYIRKVGVRSIEDTRYQARLDAKVEELALMYCSKEFTQRIYRTLAQDLEFVGMLLSVWRIELSTSVISIYRMFVMYRQPLVRTNTGYHVPTTEVVIADIRAFFDPAHLRSNAAPAAVGEDKSSHQIMAKVLTMFRSNVITDFTMDPVDDYDVQGYLMLGIKCYISALYQVNPRPYEDLLAHCPDFTVPSEISDALSKVATIQDLTLIHTRLPDNPCLPRLQRYINAWARVYVCLENPDAGPACECLFVYFFIKFGLEHGAGVPKLALALYDRMNMQLSREFVRCANPTCELSRLDQSTGKVKFKKCEKCLSAIYCSKKCQVAHHPDHKRLCREHSTG